MAAPSGTSSSGMQPVPPQNPKSVLLRSILEGCAIAAGVVFFVAYLSQPPASVKLANIVLTQHPAASKLSYWVATPVARIESRTPFALHSYFANDSDAGIDVTATLATGTACLPHVNFIQDGKHLTDGEAVHVPANNHADVLAEVDVQSCSADLRNAGISFQLHYTWTEQITPPAVPGQAQPAKVSAAFDAVATTSPIVFPTPTQIIWDQAIHSALAAYALLKDLAWPLVLAVLGFVFQQILAQQSDARAREKEIEERAETERVRKQEEEATERNRKREEEATERARKEQEAETERARQTAQEETRRAQRLQILTHLLPEYMALVQQHYLPIARRIQTVESEWLRHHAAITPPSAPVAVAATQQSAALPAAAQAAAQSAGSIQPVAPENDSYTRLLTAILLLRSRQLYLYEKKGGIFFRTSTGEEIFANCISEFTEKCQNLFGKDAFEAAAGSLDPEAKHPDAIRWFFEPRRPRPVDPANQGAAQAPLPDMQAMLAAFHAWAKDSDKMELDINLLRLCDKVLSFECDRIFYQTDPDQKMKPNATVNDASGWYFDAPQLAIDASMLDLPDPFRKEDKDKDEDGVYSRKRTFTLLRQYLERVPEECKPKGLVIPAS